MAIMLSEEAILQKFIRFCNSHLGRQAVQREAQYIFEKFKTCQLILDVGCGIGSIEAHLKDLPLVGLDNSFLLLNEAKKKSSKNFVLGDACRLPFREGVFERVFFLTSLEFMESYERALREARRVLTPRGKILVMLLNQQSHYFKQQISDENSYFRTIRQTNYQPIIDFISEQFSDVHSEYFLGMKEDTVWDTSDPNWAALYAISGVS